MPRAKAGSRRVGLEGSWAAGFQGACTPREMQFAHLHSSGADAPQPTVPTCIGLGKPDDPLDNCLHPAAWPSPAIWTCSCRSLAVTTEAISLQSPGLPQLLPHYLASTASIPGWPPQVWRHSVAFGGSASTHVFQRSIMATGTDCFNCSSLPSESEGLAHFHLLPKSGDNLLTEPMLGVSLWGVPLRGGQGGGSVSAPSLSTKPAGVGVGIPEEACVGLHLDILPTHKVKIKAWS